MSRPLRSIWRLVAQERYRYALSLLAMAGGTLAAYLIPLVVGTTIDSVLTTEPDPTTATKQWLIAALGGSAAWRTHLWISTVVITLLAALSGSLLYLKGRWAALAGETIIRNLRLRLYDQLQRLPVAFHDRSDTGDLVQRTTSDVEAVHHFLSAQWIELGRGLLLLLTVIPVMLWMDVQMALLSLVGAPVILCFGFFFFVKLQPAFRRAEEAEGRMTSTVQENLTGIRVVRAFARQDFECEKFSSRSMEFRDRRYQIIQLLAFYWPVSDVLVFAQQSAVLLWGAARVAHDTLTVGTLWAFLAMINIYIWPLRQMGRILADLSKTLVALSRIEEILHAPLEDDADQSKHLAVSHPIRAKGELRFDDVQFAYDNDASALRGVSFDVRPGETVALFGPSGSGKSTIVNLLLRLYDNYSGTILLDGHRLEDYSRTWLRRQIGVVMQEPFLFAKTVRDNLYLGNQSATAEEIVEATRGAEIHAAIEGFGDGYDTWLGERGVTLSGGQRQRMALARALLAKPAILVLDDALSAVDRNTEGKILETLFQRKGEQTTLIIAHRISTLQAADRVLVMEAGRVVQNGSHRDLVVQKGLYQRLWKIQSVDGPTPAEDRS